MSTYSTLRDGAQVVGKDIVHLRLMREIIEQITAGSPMVRILVRRPISLGLIKDLCNHALLSEES